MQTGSGGRDAGHKRSNRCGRGTIILMPTELSATTLTADRIVRLTDQLAALPHLRPDPRTNALFGELVQTVLAAPDRQALDDPRASGGRGPQERRPRSLGARRDRARAHLGRAHRDGARPGVRTERVPVPRQLSPAHRPRGAPAHPLGQHTDVRGRARLRAAPPEHRGVRRRARLPRRRPGPGPRRGRPRPTGHHADRYRHASGSSRPTPPTSTSRRTTRWCSPRWWARRRRPRL